MAKAGISFKARLRAWWEGYEALPESELEEVRRQRRAPSLTLPQTEAAPTVAPLADWETPRIRIAQLVWGAGFDKPGGPPHALNLVKPFGLDPSKSMMDFGTGLGGASRVVSKEYDVWVTGYEGDAELSRAGKQLSLIAGLDRKADIQRYVPGEFDVAPNSFDCILSHEALHIFESKYDILSSLQKGLKSRGQLSMTDFVLGEGISPNDSRLRAFQATPLDLWRPDQYEQRLGELNLDLRISEDITENYRKMILQGWMNFAQGDQTTFATAKAHPGAVIAELNLWTKRLEAMEQGLLRVARFYAIKKAGAKLMSDW
ncbi:MAG TPA: methyltransferase domain-containing protein [Dongiaceae bacterium]|nr:methyltransferase domain-containing protein [Dongiaceae bacterium]